MQAKKAILWFLVPFVLAAGLFANFWSEPDPVPTFQNGPPEEFAFGWKHDPEAIKDVVAGLRFKVFGDTEAGQADDPLPKQVFLWDAYRKVTGKLPPTKNQGQIGSCVSFGTNNAIARTLMIAAMLGQAEFSDIAEEVTYGGSRVQIGGGRLRGGDGSVGAWAAQFVQKYGVSPRVQTGNYDLREYSVARCRDFGNRGVPADLLPETSKRPVQAVTLIKSWAEAKRALASGYGLAVCSNQGFTMQRDANGVCRPSGTWPHCMCIDGYCEINGAEYGHIDNSWGPNAHTGPVGPGSPSTSGFWAQSSVVERMIKSGGDTWAFSNVKGFPPRKINWFVQRPALPQPFAKRDSLCVLLLLL